MRRTDFEDHYDVIIAGARPAGAATALLLARQGTRVLLVDRGRYGTDTLSTHALMRAGVLQLARWNVLPAIVAAGTPPIRSAAFTYDGQSLTVPIKPRDGVDALYAPRRTVLDAALVDAALDAGATIGFECALVELLHGAAGRVTGAVLRLADGDIRTVGAGLVIGADGIHSSMVKLVKAPTTARGSSSSATVFAYWRGLPRDRYGWYYAPGVSVGVIPTNDDLACVFASVPTDRFPQRFGAGVSHGYREVLKQAAPELLDVLTPEALVGRFHGFAGLPGRLKQATGPGWALVGDAAYFRDPLTSHGITDALVEAEYLACAIADGRDSALLDYSSDRDRRVRPLFDVTDRVASFEWSMDDVRALHKQLAEAMADEVRALLAFTGEKTFA